MSSSMELCLQKKYLWALLDMKISWNHVEHLAVFFAAHHDEVWMISDLHYDHKANAESATALLVCAGWFSVNHTEDVFLSAF